MTVTDPNAADLVCTPANGRRLAPGAIDRMHGRLTRSPRRTSTPATTSIPPASTTATAGAQQACDAPTSRAPRIPHLVIVKDADGAELRQRRRRHPLHDHRDQRRQHHARVGDRDRSERQRPRAASRPTARRWPPVRPLSCTASHTVTQADIDAGHYLNTACVETATGATATCDDADVPADQNPHLTIVKDATEDELQRSRRRHPLHHHRDQRRQHDARRP